MAKKPAWMNDEDDRAETQAETGGVVNEDAPKIVRPKTQAPTRRVKNIYVQDRHATAFDRLVFEQKAAKGKKGSELAEEAIELILEKYNIEL